MNGAAAAATILVMTGWRYTPDGSLEVLASRVSFAIAGVTSAAIGAVAGLVLDRYLGLRLLAYSTAAIFMFWSVRALVQAAFVPDLLTLRFGEHVIEGPKVWWLFRERMEVSEIDWSRTRELAGRLNIVSVDGRQIFTRLAWYGAEGAAVIRERMNRYRVSATERLA